MDALLRFFNLYDQSTTSEAERAQAKAWLREGFAMLLPTVPAMLVWAVVTAVAMVAAGLPAGYVVLDRTLSRASPLPQ